MGNNTSSAHALSLLKVPLGHHHSVMVYADEVATRRENPGSEIEVMDEAEKLLCPIDPEGGVVALAVWPGAIELSIALVSSSINFSQARILEIGCGVGLPGISLAKYFGPKEVVLSDRGSARTSVEASIASNNQQNVCRFETFDWGSSTDLKTFSSTTFDYIIGSEIVYAEEQAPLINALLAVSSSASHPRIILSYRNRSEADESYFNSEILKYFKIEEKISENIFIFSRKLV